MNRYVCIHGHFYQPPRENPWLDTIEIQDSAHPFRNWNERVTTECYTANAFSRVLDPHHKISDIVNNYSRINFNFGPTLLSWMEIHVPDTYQAILDADHESQRHFSGHGSAMTQAYNHMIMPLANDRDKQTQVIWGIKDFSHRFKRLPEGMWLPETAVDLKTLEVLAQYGIKYTVLAPGQAKRVRKTGEEKWAIVEGGKVDPQQPYLCKLPSGRQIALFFYDGPISHDVAFGGLLNNGEMFAKRFVNVFPSEQKEPRLVHIATDGETYGHHHKFGNMALSFGLNYLSTNQPARLTNYGEYLMKFPPTHEVEIVVNSSWSCAHGIGRWSEDCGCSVGGNPGWNQKWRKSLFESMNWLRDRLSDVFVEHLSRYVKDPWQARDEYIHLLLDRSSVNREKFFTNHAQRELSASEKITVLKLLEMQKCAMFMYTSCGWFFDDISGIEPRQILQYACRAIQLAKEVSSIDFENEYMAKLAGAESNDPEMMNGQVIYERYVKAGQVDLKDMGAHYAIESYFAGEAKEKTLYVYKIKPESYEKFDRNGTKLILGRAAIQSTVTLEERMVDFAVYHSEELNVNGFAAYDGNRSFAELKENLHSVIARGEHKALVQFLEQHFAGCHYSLWDLFREERNKAFDKIFSGSVHSLEDVFRQVYDQYSHFMLEGKSLYISLPRALSIAIEYIFQKDLISILESDPLDFEKLRTWAAAMKKTVYLRDTEVLSRVASEKLTTLMERLNQNPEDTELLHLIMKLLNVFQGLHLPLDLWKSQNLYFSLGQSVYKKRRAAVLHGDTEAKQWVEYFDLLGNLLTVKIH